MLTTHQAAQRSGVSRRVVQRLIASGHLPAQRLGRDWLIDERHLSRIDNRPSVGWKKGRSRRKSVTRKR